MRLAGKGKEHFNQASLQASYYTLFEPEVEASCQTILRLIAFSKDNVKGIRKAAKTYLLDKLELNVKSRCVFAWSGKDVDVDVAKCK